MGPGLIDSPPVRPSGWAALLGRLRSLFSPSARTPTVRAALLSAMEETSQDAIITIDQRGLMLSFNPAAQRLFGYLPDEVIGRNVKMLMPNPFRDEHDGYIGRYMGTGEKRIIGIGRVVAGQKKDGAVFPLELSVGESRVEGAPVFVGFIRDLTDIQSEQRRVQELQRELFHVSRLGEMGQLVSSLAHEVNQPLAAIVNYIQVARQMADSAGDEAARRIGGVLEKVEAQTTRAADIIKRLRAFIDRREGERRRENPRQLIEEALALGLVGPASRTARLVLDIAPALPDVEVDRVQVQQVIVNLIRNAVDAMEGSSRRELIVGAVREGADFVCVSVGDTGSGIAPEVAPRLFGAFVTTKPDGMGVGLSICKTIIDAHGGRIACEARASGGTTFSFTLPVHREPAA
ncbi:MAG: PAS domain S-box protein [Alphaproteobacteria bacterium]|nr:PAS domain S-box protein [Alphaproteobacteria bacterium]